MTAAAHHSSSLSLRSRLRPSTSLFLKVCTPTPTPLSLTSLYPYTTLSHTCYDITLTFLTKGASLTKRALSGVTALHELIYAGCLDVLKSLYSSSPEGAKLDFNEGDRRGYTCLHFACLRTADENSIPMIKFLIEHGANVNGLTNSQITPLQAALKSYQDDSAIVAALCEAGADVNLTMPETDSPLFQVLFSFFFFFFSFSSIFSCNYSTFLLSTVNLLKPPAIRAHSSGPRRKSNRETRYNGPHCSSSRMLHQTPRGT
jgi:ankyrin repeat protein